MQYIINGPEIPDALIHEHEDGNLVFFCGAGISCNAGLPLFDSFVEKIYEKFGEAKDELEKRAFENKQYDKVLNLFEKRVGRVSLRQTYKQILEPNFKSEHAKTIHESLLELSKNKKGNFQIVTTNVDRIFEEIIKDLNLNVTRHIAPALPIPKKESFGSLVYLHGLLPKNSDINLGLENLVFTSGDFGRAYLIEAWATKFIIELFRNYTVCFIGYSIEDPILRYMVDAIAGENTEKDVNFKKPYAFASYKDKDKDKDKSESESWKAKNVIPILYKEDKASGKNDKELHHLLRETIERWADKYKKGLQGKFQTINEIARLEPSESTQEDNYIGRLLWAISDISGKPAEKFAEIQPTPSIKWLKVFEEKRFGFDDLSCFGVTKNKSLIDDKFSILNRPCSELSYISLFESTVFADDKIINGLFDWLCKHIYEPEFLLWVFKQKNRLSDVFLKKIWDKVLEATTEEKNKYKYTLNLWKLYLNKSILNDANVSFYELNNSIEKKDLKNFIRKQFLNLIKPSISVKRDDFYNPEFKNYFPQEASNKAKNIDKHFFNTKINVALSDYEYNEITKNDNWKEIIFDLILDFNQLLKYLMDLKSQTGKTSENFDYTYFNIPSISYHKQNDKRYESWKYVIYLLRDSWILHHEQNSKMAEIILSIWLEEKFSIYRRFALFAATYDGVADNGEWVDWVLDNNSIWLWHPGTRRELMVLLRSGKVLKLSKNRRIELFKAILKGPSREKYNDDITDEKYENIKNGEIWLRLKKIEQVNEECLSKAVVQRLNELSIKYPKWKLSEDESDEFSFFIGDCIDSAVIDLEAPTEVKELSIWISQPIDNTRHDNWREVCQNDFNKSFRALKICKEQNKWFIKRFSEALDFWNKEDRNYLVKEIFDFILELEESIHKKLMQINSLARWFEEYSKKLNLNNKDALSFCIKLIKLKYNKVNLNNISITSSLNNSIGILTTTLFKFLTNSKVKDDDLIPENIKEVFDFIIEKSKKSNYWNNGLLVICSRLNMLFRLDLEWTKEKLLPLFKISDHHDISLICWNGFLWMPRKNDELIELLKDDLLELYNRINKISEAKNKYVNYLTYLFTDIDEAIITKKEKRVWLKNLNNEDLVDVLSTLNNFLVSSKDKKANYYSKVITPFWNLWPKDKNKKSPEISEQLTQIAINSGDDFDDAVVRFKGFFMSFNENYYFTLLENSKCCSNFPDSALKLLDNIAPEKRVFYLSESIIKCLDQISTATPNLKNNEMYTNLYNKFDKTKP